MSIFLLTLGVLIIVSAIIFLFIRSKKLENFIALLCTAVLIPIGLTLIFNQFDDAREQFNELKTAAMERLFPEPSPPPPTPEINPDEKNISKWEYETPVPNPLKPELVPESDSDLTPEPNILTEQPIDGSGTGQGEGARPPQQPPDAPDPPPPEPSPPLPPPWTPEPTWPPPMT